MPRDINVPVLDGYGEQFASWWLTGRHPSRSLGPMGRDGLAKEIWNLHFRDEFEYLIDAIRKHLGDGPRTSFDAMIDNLRAREDWDDAEFHNDLAVRLAVDKHGNHINGRKGKVQVGTRFVGHAAFQVEAPWSIRRRKMLGMPIHAPGRTDRELITVVRRVAWPIYAGEEHERGAIEAGERRYVQEGLDIIDPLPFPSQVMALNTRISNEAAIAACNSIVDSLDEGSTAATIRGRTGAQPADPDTAESGTLLFTLTCSDPAFGAAADANPGGRATASAITDDSSADATGTLSYLRAGATGTGADDHIDGEAGTATADFIFNTLSIVSGATVSMTSWTFTVPES